MKKLLMALAMFCATFALQAEVDGYAMLSVFSPGQLPVPVTSIYGVRFNLIYGECQNLNGLDLGIVGRVREHANGLQICGGNVIGTDVSGAQLGLVNLVESDFAGFQLALWNDVGGHASGFQCGLWNEIGAHGAGFQLGLVNRAKSLSGLQIGLLNFIDDQRFYLLPLINVGW